MKKIFYMAAAALAFAACSKDDTDKIDTLTVTPETATVFTDGKLPELSIAGTPADALEGAEITWTSSNPEVVAVSADGKISFAVKDIAEEATVEISASACGKTASCIITVKPQIAHYEILDLTAEFGFKMLDRNVGASDVLKSGNYYQWGKNTPVAAESDSKVNAAYDAEWGAGSKDFSDWSVAENTPCPLGWGLPDGDQMKKIADKLEAIALYDYDMATKEEYEAACTLLNKMMVAKCGQFGKEGHDGIYLPDASYFWSAARTDAGLGVFENNLFPNYFKKAAFTMAVPVRCVKK